MSQDTTSDKKYEAILHIRNMREKLNKCAYYGERLDGKTYSVSVASVLIRKTLEHACISGISGEDTMTALAFNALSELEAQYDAQLLEAQTSIKPQFIFGKDGK